MDEADDNTVNLVFDLDSVCEGGVMNIKASLLRYCEMSWEALTSFKSFMKWSTFSRFDAAELTTPSLRVAMATNERGEPIVFCPIESVMFISGYAMKPKASRDEALRAGDVIDAEVARLGQRLGVTKLMIALPDGVAIPACEGETIRVHIRKIPQSVAMGAAITTPSTAVAYVN